MYGRNHIAAVIVSTAMVFSMMPLGVAAAEQTGTEVNVQLETGIAEAGDYINAGERSDYYSVSDWSISSASVETESWSDAGFRENDTGAEDGRGVAGSEEETAGDAAGADSEQSGSDATGSGSGVSGGSGSSAAGDTAGTGSDAVNGEGADGGTASGGAANGGATGGGSASGAGETGKAGSAAENMSGANGTASEAATDQAANAGTDAAYAEETSLVSIHGIVGREFVQYGEIDSETMAGLYFDREDQEELGVESGAALKGVDKVIYNALRKAVEEIAAGLRDSGIVRIPISAGVTGLKSRYTAADLGLEYVYSGSLNPDLMEALEKAAPVHYDEIMDCLIADSACAMFPLTGGVEKPEGYTLPFYASGSGDDLDVFWDDYVEIALKPAEEYADPDSGKYAIDVARIKVARGTAGTAKRIAKSASHIAYKSGFIPTTK